MDAMRRNRTRAPPQITSESPDGLTGELPASSMSFFYDILPVPRPVRAELPTRPVASIASQLGLRPRPSLYDAAMQDLGRLAASLAAVTSAAFVMSDQYASSPCGRMASSPSRCLCPPHPRRQLVAPDGVGA